MATSSCSGVQSGTSANTSPVAGLTTFSVPGLSAGCPSMVSV
jgi:hypothetical protein